MGSRRKKARLQAGDPRDESGEDEGLTGVLPDDTMLQIFDRVSTRKLLTQAALVCRRWWRLCNLQVREIVPPVVSSGKPIWASRKDVLNLVRKHASTIHRIQLDSLRLKEEDVISIISSLSQLRDLSLLACVSSLTKLVACLPSQLHRLSLHKHASPSPPESLAFDFFSALHSQCPGLNVLELDHLTVTDKSLTVMVQRFPNLTSLGISSSLIGWEEVDKIFRGCKYLRHFSLESTSLLVAKPESLVNDLPPLLRSLRLYSSMHRSISFASPLALKMIKQGGHQIEALHAHTSFSANWQVISSSCTNVKVLDLSCIKCSDTDMELTKHEEWILCKIPCVLPKLERVGLPTGNDRILAQFGRACPQLLEIRFQNLGPGKNSTLVRVTDWGVMALVEGCSKLEVLSLDGCEKITVSSTRSIMFHCANLKILHLNGCKLLDDHAISVLFPRLSDTLRLLDLNGCLISNATLKHIEMHGGTSLRILAIQQALWKKSQSWVKQMRSWRPHLLVKAGIAYEWTGFYNIQMLADL